MKLRELRRALADPRFSGDEEVLVRVVDRTRRAENGSYHADEYPITGGLTGWTDGHASFLAEMS